MSSTAVLDTKGRFMENPAIKKVRAAAAKEGASDRAASYGGVIAKTVYFLIVTLVGIGAFFALDTYFTNLAGGYELNLEIKEGIMVLNTTVDGALAIAVVAALTLVTALISIFVRAAVPVTGTIYVLCEGYLLAFINNMLTEEYKWIGILALILTISIVLSLLFLYAKGAIKPSRRFMKIIFTVFIAIVLGGILMFVFRFIPGLSAVVNAYDQMMANPVISIIFGVVFILIACLFLVSDFEAVRQIVDSGADKKYEWGCAFGVAYTVLYLYIKIFEIIIKIVGNAKK